MGLVSIREDSKMLHTLFFVLADIDESRGIDNIRLEVVNHICERMG
jgi:hypothetical protein